MATTEGVLCVVVIFLGPLVIMLVIDRLIALAQWVWENW